MLLLPNGAVLLLLVLDIDGTTTRIERLISNLKLAAAVAGFDPRRIDVYFEEVYRGARPFLNNLREGAGAAFGVDSGPRFEKFERTFHALEKTMPYELVEGAVERIEWARSHSVKVAFLTANGLEASRKKVSYGGLDPGEFFFATANSRFIKPDPRAFQDVLAEFKVDGYNALHVGDSNSDYYVTRLKIEEREIEIANFCGVLSGVYGEEAFSKLGVGRNQLLPSVAHLPDFLKAA